MTLTAVPAVSIANPFMNLRGPFGTILADPPWQFTNKTGKVAPEHRRLHRYATMTLDEIMALPVEELATPTAHLYLWCPNALLPEGLAVMAAWGFDYKSNVVWHKLRKDGGSDGRGVGFYFRNVTELILFGVRGKNARTLAPGRRQVNLLATRKREHSRKPDELYPIIEACSRGHSSSCSRAAVPVQGGNATPTRRRSAEEATMNTRKRMKRALQRQAEKDLERKLEMLIDAALARGETNIIIEIRSSEEGVQQ